MAAKNDCQKSTLDSVRLITLKDVMNITGMGRTYLYQLEKANQLIPIRVGRNLRYVERDVTTWIDMQIQKSLQKRGGK